MKRVTCIILIFSVLIVVSGCGNKPAQSVVKVEEQDAEGVRKAIEFKQKMDAQIEQQMKRMMPPPPAQPQGNAAQPPANPAQ